MVLPEQDYKDFIFGHHRLLQFAGLKYNLISPNLNFREFLSVQFNLKVKCREKLLNDPKILDEYIESKDGNLDEVDRDIIKAFRSRVSDDFVVLRTLRNYTIFIGKKKIYGVTALNDPIIRILIEFPAYVKATLIPYRSFIVYDGFLAPYSIEFGKNIRRSMNLEYQAAKKSGMIIVDPKEI